MSEPSEQFRSIVSGMGDLASSGEDAMRALEQGHEIMHGLHDNVLQQIHIASAIINHPHTTPERREEVTEGVTNDIAKFHTYCEAHPLVSKFVSRHSPDYGADCKFPGCERPKMRWPWAEE